MEKIIHYCWFGPKPLPKLAKKCIASWEKYIPDYEIKLWLEKNVDLSGKSKIIKINKELAIYPREYFYPLSYDRKNNIFTENTYGIHYYDDSWINFTSKVSLWLTKHNLGYLTKILYSIYNFFNKKNKKKENRVILCI